MIFPLHTPPKTAFQLGELDLFLSSQIAGHRSFVGELVVGSSDSNEWGLDMERLQQTYKANDYFSLSGGRFHSAIGYYNTAFHHGTWFQTAQGRPFMYYFEDAGGILPVHNVGLTATGAVPGTSKLGLHWIAELGNGRSSSPVVAPVQNFVSDRNRKSINFAAYIRPEAVSGLQIGTSFYLDKLAPIENAVRVTQQINSFYALYSNVKCRYLTRRYSCETAFSPAMCIGRRWHALSFPENSGCTIPIFAINI